VTRVSIVAAVARNGVIGKAGRLPWHLPEDMRRFRRVTDAHPVVMGRRTWESLPERFRPLPGRRNVVVTRSAGWRAPGAETAGTFDAALALVAGADKVCVLGGAELFAEALPRADELELTEIDCDVDGDTFFPPWPRDAFELVARETHSSTPGWRLHFSTYRRRRDQKP